jgi:hypothetical protein
VTQEPIKTVTVTVRYIFDFSIKELGWEEDPVGMAMSQVEEMVECVEPDPYEVVVETA